MILKFRRSVGAAAVVAALAACGDGSGSTDDDQDAAARIVATTTIWADITSATLCGLDVPALVPPGADPHTFEPSLRDREALEDAAVVIANGGGLEDSLTDLLSSVATSGTDVVELVPLVDTIDSGPGHDDDHDDDDHDDDDHDDDDHDDHDHDDHDDDPDHDDHDDDHAGGVDPHIWQDPLRVAGVLDTIAAAGEEADEQQRNCANAYRAELEQLDDEISELIGAVPIAERLMVTSHDSLAYFADRYDLEIVGTVIPSTNTLAQTNAADLADLADLIEERGVRAIFTEELESTADADALAERLDVLVVPLVTDALTTAPGTDTYLEMMRSNSTRIAEALTP